MTGSPVAGPFLVICSLLLLSTGCVRKQEIPLHELPAVREEIPWVVIRTRSGKDIELTNLSMKNGTLHGGSIAPDRHPLTIDLSAVEQIFRKEFSLSRTLLAASGASFGLLVFAVRTTVGD